LYYQATVFLGNLLYMFQDKYNLRIALFLCTTYQTSHHLIFITVYHFFSYLGDKILIIYLYPRGHTRLSRELPKIHRRSFIRGSEGTTNTLYKYRRERRAYLRDILLVAAVMCTNSATEIASVVTEKLRRPIIKVLHQRSVMLRSRSLARVYYMRYCCNEAQ